MTTAEAIKLKRYIYRETMTSFLTKLSVALNLLTLNFEPNVDSMKDLIHHTLVVNCNYDKRRGIYMQSLWKYVTLLGINFVVV